MILLYVALYVASHGEGVSILYVNVPVSDYDTVLKNGASRLRGTSCLRALRGGCVNYL